MGGYGGGGIGSVAAAARVSRQPAHFYRSRRVDLDLCHAGWNGRCFLHSVSRDGKQIVGTFGRSSVPLADCDFFIQERAPQKCVVLEVFYNYQLIISDALAY